MMLNQLAINSNTYHGLSLDNAVKGASKAGFSQIELAGTMYHTNHVFPTMTDKEIADTQQLLQNYGMTCVGISAHSNVMTKEGINYLLDSIDLAETFNCKYVITATGDSHGDTDVIDDIEKLVENLQPVFEKCKRLQKVLVIETHGNNFATGVS